MPDALLLIAAVGLPFIGAIAAAILPTHARTAAAVCKALLPGRWKMTMAVATWLFSSALIV